MSGEGGGGGGGGVWPADLPKIIHQSWKTKSVPKKWRASQQAWQKLHPNFQYKLWTDKDNLRLIETEYPELLHLYKSYPYPIMRVDLARYCILHKYGGIYCDLDQQPLKSVEPFFNGTNAEAYFCSTSVALVTNSIMVSKPGARVWETVFEELQRAFEDPMLNMLCRHWYIINVSGPWALTRALGKYKDGVLGLIPSVFNPHSYEEERPSDKDPLSLEPHNASMKKLASGSWHAWDSKLFESAARHKKLVTVLIIICAILGFLLLVCWIFIASKWLVVKTFFGSLPTTTEPPLGPNTETHRTIDWTCPPRSHTLSDQQTPSEFAHLDTVDN